MKYPLAFDAWDPHAILNAHPRPWGVLAYCDGEQAAGWSAAMQDGLFDHSRRRYISVIPSSGAWRMADIFDCEEGCYTPAQAAASAKARLHELDSVPTIYVDRDWLPEVVAACKQAGVSAWNLWLTTLDGTIPAEVDGIRPVAVQFQGGPTAPFDVSAVLRPGWMRPPPPLTRH